MIAISVKEPADGGLFHAANPPSRFLSKFAKHSYARKRTKMSEATHHNGDFTGATVVILKLCTYLEMIG